MFLYKKRNRGVREGGQEGALAPPPPHRPLSLGLKENVLYVFEKNSIFQANNIFCPSPGPIWKKFVDAHVSKKIIVCNPIIVFF